MSDPLKVKDLGEIEVPASKHDFDLSDRYQNFSAEMLRLSLLGIAGVGFLIANVLLNLLPKDPNQQAGRPHLSTSAPIFSGLAAASLICLGLSSAASLAHRYLATDGLAYHLKSLRLIVRKRAEDEDRVRKEKAGRRLVFKLGTWSLIAAAVLLGLGAILLALAFVFGLLYG